MTPGSRSRSARLPAPLTAGLWAGRGSQRRPSCLPSAGARRGPAGGSVPCLRCAATPGRRPPLASLQHPCRPDRGGCRRGSAGSRVRQARVPDPQPRVAGHQQPRSRPLARRVPSCRPRASPGCARAGGTGYPAAGRAAIRRGSHRACERARAARSDEGDRRLARTGNQTARTRSVLAEIEAPGRYRGRPRPTPAAPLPPRASPGAGRTTAPAQPWRRPRVRSGPWDR